jgi:hypothetical protein
MLGLVLVESRLRRATERSFYLPGAAAFTASGCGYGDGDRDGGSWILTLPP